MHQTFHSPILKLLVHLKVPSTQLQHQDEHVGRPQAFLYPFVISFAHPPQCVLIHQAQFYFIYSFHFCKLAKSSFNLFIEDQELVIVLSLPAISVLSSQIILSRSLFCSQNDLTFSQNSILTYFFKGPKVSETFKVLSFKVNGQVKILQKRTNLFDFWSTYQSFTIKFVCQLQNRRTYIKNILPDYSILCYLFHQKPCYHKYQQQYEFQLLINICQTCQRQFLKLNQYIKLKLNRSITHLITLQNNYIRILLIISFIPLFHQQDKQFVNSNKTKVSQQMRKAEKNPQPQNGQIKREVMSGISMSLIKFNFPNTQSFILKSYRKPEQFQEFIKVCNKELMGFSDIITYNLHIKSKKIENRKCQAESLLYQKAPIQPNISQTQQNIGRAGQSKNIEMVVHKWECQICFAYIAYKLNRETDQYYLKKFNLAHHHDYEHFRPYLIQKQQKYGKQLNMNQFSRNITNLVKIEDAYQRDHYLPFNFNYGYLPQSTQNLRQAHLPFEFQYNIDPQQQHGFQNNKSKMGEKPRKRRKYITKKFKQRQLQQQEERKKKQAQQGQKIDLQQQNQQYTQRLPLSKSQQQLMHKLPQPQIPKQWTKSTQKLIDYLQPHSFIFPTIRDFNQIFCSFNAHNINKKSMNGIFKKQFLARKQFENQVWATEVDNYYIGPGRIKFVCFCLQDLVSQCPYTLVYELDNKSGFRYNPLLSNTQHRHLQERLQASKTKYYQILRFLTNYRQQAVGRGYVKNKQFLLKYIVPKILQERFTRDKSILLIIPEARMRQLFNLNYIAYTKQKNYKSYDQIKRNRAQLLVQGKLQNHVVLFISPIMQQLFKSYNRILIIQEERILQQFDVNKTYSVFSFKGVSYTGNLIYFGFGLIKDCKLQKIQIMLQIFMQKHDTIPNLVLISQFNPVLYGKVKQFFEFNYPQSVIKTREILDYQNFKVINQDKAGSSQYVHYNLCQLQERYINFINDYSFNVTKYLAQRLFHYDNLIKCNSFLIDHSSFLGTNMNAVIHSQTDKTLKISNMYHTNLEQALQKLFFQVYKNNQIVSKQKVKEMFNLHAQKKLKIDQLHALRIAMSRKPYLALVHRIMKIPKTTIAVSNPPHFYIVQSIYTSHIVTVNPAKRNPLLKCDCKIRQRTGIPCQHILKIALNQDINFMDCIDKFWLIDTLAFNLYAVQPGQPTKTQFIINPTFQIEGRKRIYHKLFKSKKLQSQQSDLLDLFAEQKKQIFQQI